METQEGRCYARLAAAYVRGEARSAIAGIIQSEDADIRAKPLALPEELLRAPLDQLTGEQLARCAALGRAAGLKLYRFKNNHAPLPRVKAVLGFLKGISFDSLLDVGSGRGAFLWPFLEAFPWVEVTCLDLLPLRVEFLRKTALGGVSNLRAVQGDVCTWEAREKSADVVTMLEVLEHIADTRKALAAAQRVARKYILVSVPSKPDDNPEHIHLFTKDSLTAHFAALGCENLRFEGVNGHLLLYVKL